MPEVYNISTQGLGFLFKLHFTASKLNHQFVSLFVCYINLVNLYYTFGSLHHQHVIKYKGRMRLCHD